MYVFSRTHVHAPIHLTYVRIRVPDGGWCRGRHPRERLGSERPIPYDKVVRPDHDSRGYQQQPQGGIRFCDLPALSPRPMTSPILSSA